MTFSTSGHDRKCFRFLKNIIKVYIWHFFWLIRVWRIWWWCFQLPVITGSTSGFPKTLKNVTSTNICLLVPYNCQPRCFFLSIHVRRFFWSYFQLPVITGSTSGFLKIIKTRNLDMFSEQFEYAEFNEDILNFRLWLPVMSGHFRFVENIKKACPQRCFRPLSWLEVFLFSQKP